MNLTDDFISLEQEFIHLFNESPYSPKYSIIKSYRAKDAILYLGYYFNHQRVNKRSIVFKCRHNDSVTHKECTSTFI